MFESIRNWIQTSNSYAAQGLRAPINYFYPAPQDPPPVIEPLIIEEEVAVVVPARWVDALALTDTQKDKLFTAKNRFLEYLQTKTANAPLLANIADRWQVSNDIKTVFDNLTDKTQFDKIPALTAPKIAALATLNPNLLKSICNDNSHEEIDQIATAVAAKPNLKPILVGLSNPQRLKFIALTDTQAATFATVSGQEALTHLHGLDIAPAQTLLDNIAAKPNLNTAFTFAHKDIAAYQSLSNDHLGALNGIAHLDIKLAAFSLSTQNATDLATLILAPTQIVKLAKDKLTDKTNLAKLVHLDNTQITTYLSLTNTDTLRALEALPEDNIKKFLNQTAAAPNLQAALNRLTDKSKIDKLSQLSTQEIKIFATCTDTAQVDELANLTLPQLQNFCAMTAPELQNYFTATKNRNTLKGDLKDMPSADLKRFATDFTTAVNPNVTQTLDYLNANAGFVKYSALLPDATPAQRADKNLYLSLNTVKTSNVRGHAEGDTAPVGGGHFSSGFKYNHTDSLIYNNEDKLRFRPADVTAPANYKTTHIDTLAAPPPNIAPLAVAVIKVSNLEIKDALNAWNNKGNPSTMFPTSWSLDRIEAETALAYMKISDNPAAAYTAGNAYEITSSPIGSPIVTTTTVQTPNPVAVAAATVTNIVDGITTSTTTETTITADSEITTVTITKTLVMRVCIGPIGAVAAFAPNANRDTPIKTAFPR